MTIRGETRSRAAAGTLPLRQYNLYLFIPPSSSAMDRVIKWRGDGMRRWFTTMTMTMHGIHFNSNTYQQRIILLLQPWNYYHHQPSLTPAPHWCCIRIVSNSGSSMRGKETTLVAGSTSSKVYDQTTMQQWQGHPQKELKSQWDEKWD
jgi:hypothetical protein